MVRAFNLRDGVAIAQIVLFTPAFLFAYSFYRTSRIGWFTVGVFALLRLIGASTRLASISRSSDSLSTTTYICESLGIILLIFLYQEFMERINKVHHIVHHFCFRAISVVMLIDLGLAIGSWVTMSSRSEANVLLPNAWTKASSAVIFCVFVYEVGLFAWFWRSRSGSPPFFGPEERRLLIAPAIITLPMLVRNVHPLIFVGVGTRFWNQVVGNGFVYLFMIMIPEVIIVGVAVWCIRGVTPLPKEKKGNVQAGRDDERSHSELETPLQDHDARVDEETDFRKARMP